MVDVIAYRFADWCERHHLPYDTQDLALDSSSISEWMQSLGESDTQRYQFLQTWIQQLQSERGVWFDITSVSSIKLTKPTSAKPTSSTAYDSAGH